jgi:hypothetical protein
MNTSEEVVRLEPILGPGMTRLLWFLVIVHLVSFYIISEHIRLSLEVLQCRCGMEVQLKLTPSVSDTALLLLSIYWCVLTKSPHLVNLDFGSDVLGSYSSTLA